MGNQPTSLPEYIDTVRQELICARCGRYVGSLAPRSYLPPPYPVAVGQLAGEDEAEALIGFEWYMVGILREGKAVIRHPERNGRCISYREWIASDDEDEDPEAVS
jgi:hypothetical protein